MQGKGVSCNGLVGEVESLDNGVVWTVSLGCGVGWNTFVRVPWP